MATKIKLIIGSIANTKAPFIVVPRDTDGQISISFQRLPQLKNNPIDKTPSEAGAVFQVSNLRAPKERTDDSQTIANQTEKTARLKSPTSKTSLKDRKKVKGIFLATSVIAPNGKPGGRNDFTTKPEIINQIGRQLAIMAKEHEIDRIACPLLGTGSGNLEAREAYIKLAKGVEVSGVALTFEIYVLEQKQISELGEVNLSKYDAQGNYIPNEERMDVKIETMSDTPITDISEDKLDFKTFAHALAGIIDSTGTKTPLTLVINAPWGAGKSSLGNLVKRNLDTMPAHSMEKHRTIWFNAWKHDESDYLKTAFTAFIAREINPYRSWWNQLWDPMSLDLTTSSDRFKRHLRSIIYVVVVTGLLVAFIHLLYSVPLLKPLMNSLKPYLPKWIEANWAIGGTSLLSITLFRYLFQFTSTLKSFIKDPKPEANAGNFKQVERELHKLIDQAIPEGRRLIIFVDDLERCRKTGPVDLLETINQLLDHPKVVTVILADIHTVAASADLKYEDFSKRYNPSNSHFGTRSRDESGAYGRLYIQKIIQLQFDLPIFDPKGIEVLVKDDSQSSNTNVSVDLSSENEEQASAFLSRLYEMVTSTMDRTMVSVRDLSRDTTLNPAAIFVLMVIRVLMYPVSLVSYLERLLFGHRWDVNVDEERGSLFKRTSFVLTLLFITFSVVSYYQVIVNGLQRFTINQYKPEYVQEFVQMGDSIPWQSPPPLIDSIPFRDSTSENKSISMKDSVQMIDSVRLMDTVLLKGSNPLMDSTQARGVPLPQMIEYMKTYLHRRDTADWENLREEDRLRSWADTTFYIFGYLKPVPVFNDNFPPTNSPAIIFDMKNLMVDYYRLKSRFRRDSISTDSAYSLLFNRMETSTHAFINGYVYESTKLPYENLFISLSALLLLLIGGWQWIAMKNVYNRHQALLDAYKTQVNENTKEGWLSSDVYDPALSKEAQEQIKRTVLYSKIENRSEKYRQALSITLEILDLVLPRNAKRVSNKLRLMFNIAFERDILGDLEAHHFAKWVALQEAYPEVVTYISRNTQEMEELETACEAFRKENQAREEESLPTPSSTEPNENAPKDTAFETFMNKIDGKLAQDPHIIDFILHGGQTYKLSRKIRQLVYFTK